MFSKLSAKGKGLKRTFDIARFVGIKTDAKKQKELFEQVEHNNADLMFLQCSMIILFFTAKLQYFHSLSGSYQRL